MASYFNTMPPPQPNETFIDCGPDPFGRWQWVVVRYTVQSTQMLQAIIDRNTAWFQSFQRAEDAGRSGLGDSGMDIVSVSEVGGTLHPSFSRRA